MRTFLNDFLIQLKGIWARLDGGQRLVVVAVLGATVVGLGGIVWYAGRPSYEAVFKASNAEEITQMQGALQQAGVAYVIADDGLTFTVERSKVGMAQLAKNKAGLTSKSDPVIGGTSSLMDDAQTKAFKLAQASIAIAQDAIMELQGVVAVKINANKPAKTSAFRDSAAQNRPSATVILRLQPGTPFMDIAKAAANVAASQLLIPLENVTVHSSTGAQKYNYDPDREAGGGSSEFLNLQRNLGEEKAMLAQARLDQLWPGKTSVAVTVELDPNWEVTSQKILPTEQIVSTEKSTKDKTEKTQGKTDPNAATTDPSPKDLQQNSTSDRSYVTEIGEKRSGKMAPDIKRMTVAVLYDKSLEKIEGFSPDDLKKAVKSIVGWNSKRDDEADFSTLPGDFQPLELGSDLATGPGFVDLALRWGPTVGQILGVIVVVMFLKGLFKRSGKAAVNDEPLVAASAKEENLTPEEQQKRMRREIERSIATDPAALAKLLESWLTEQKA
jgi:flagellar M-ring protein FliF